MNGLGDEIDNGLGTKSENASKNRIENVLFGIGIPVKKLIAANAIPMTDKRGKITPVSCVLIPIKEDSNVA